MDIYQTALSRRSIRRFKNIAVPYDALERGVDAGRLAPTGRNRQLCEYIIVDNEELLPKVFDSITIWGGQPTSLGGPPPEHRPKAYVIIMINNTLEAELGGSRMTTIYDVGMAAENIILVALEQGIATCPILSFKQEELKQILNIPGNYEVALVLALGLPDESPVLEISDGQIEYWVDSQGTRHVPKRKLEDILHRNKFP